MEENEEIKPKKTKTWIKLFLGVNLVLLVAFVALELSGGEPKTKEELRMIDEEGKVSVQDAMTKNPAPAEQTGLSPEITFTIDATDMEKWAHFDFSTGTLFYKPTIDKGSMEWDIAFRRAKVATNGGATNPDGQGAVAATEADFDAVTHAPEEGYALDEKTDNLIETKNLFIGSWYVYDFWKHKLNPKPTVYAVKTADGKYVKMQIVSYYCGKVPACYTVRYVYQGNGSNSFM